MNSGSGGEGDVPPLCPVEGQPGPAALLQQQMKPPEPDKYEFVLTKVFRSYLNPADLNTCDLVCPLWSHIRRVKIGFPLFIGQQSSPELYPDVKFHPPSILSFIASSKLVVSHLGGGGGTSTSCEGFGPIKYPETIEQLLLHGPISAPNFNAIAGPLPTAAAADSTSSGLKNLIEIAFDWSTLNSLPLDQVCLGFPKLKCFRLWNLKPETTNLETGAKWTPFVRGNLLHLLQQANYPILTKVFLTSIPICRRDRPYYGNNVGPIVLGIIGLISRHKGTLRKLLLVFFPIEVPDPAQPVPATPASAASPGQSSPASALDSPPPASEEDEDVTTFTDLASTRPILESCAGLSLTHGYIHCFGSTAALPPIGLLGQILLQNSSRAASMYLATTTYTPLPNRFLLNNGATLSQLELDVSSADDGFIDCTHFHGCERLRVLTLIGRRTTKQEERTIVTRSMAMAMAMDGEPASSSTSFIPQLIETNRLPFTSLQVLRICRLRMSTSHANCILANPGRKLLVVELQEIGQSAGLGVSFGAINQALNSYTIQKISLRKAINLDSIVGPPLASPSPGATAAAATGSMESIGRIFLKEKLDEDEDYQFGLNLMQSEEEEGSAAAAQRRCWYKLDWDQEVDIEHLFTFTGSSGRSGDPKMYYQTSPIDLEDLDKYDDDDVEDEDEDEEEGDDEDEEMEEEEGDDDDEEMMEDEDDGPDEGMDYEDDDDDDDDEDGDGDGEDMA